MYRPRIATFLHERAALEARQREERAAMFDLVGSLQGERAAIAVAEQAARHAAERRDLEHRYTDADNHEGRGR